MSRSFRTTPTSAYKGVALPAPVELCKAPALPPAVVRIDIDFADYWNASLGESVGVIVNLEGSVQGKKLDRIASVKIDNVGNTTPVYVIAPDTLDVVTCPPNAVVTMPIFTNAPQVSVIADGITAGFIPAVRVYLSNVMLQPSVDPEIQVVYPQWRGSPSIQRENILTPGFSSPALGDQTGQYELNLSAVNTTSNLFGSPYATGFVYLTHVYVNLIDCDANPAVTFNLIVDYAAAPQTLYDWLFRALPSNDTSYNRNFCLYQLQGGQLRLDATKNWRFRNTALLSPGTALANLIVNYTYNEQ